MKTSKSERAPKNQYWELEFQTSTGPQTVSIQAKSIADALAVVSSASYLEPSARLVRGGLG